MKSSSKISKKKVVLYVIGGLLVLCILCVAFGTILNNTPSGKATQTAVAVQTSVRKIALATQAAIPTNTAVPTNTPEPTKTLVPTNTLAPTETPEPTETKDPNRLEVSEQAAFISVTKEIVLKALKAPSSAKFPNLLLEGDQWRIGKKGDVVTVVSWVDAQNSFGAMLRNDFILQYSYSTKDLLYFQFAGEDVIGKLQK